MTLFGHALLELKWVGATDHHLDDPSVQNIGSMVLGIYGGSSDTGANKNEDGALLWSNDNGDWEFAVSLDGHNTSESVQLVLDDFTYRKQDIMEILSDTFPTVFERLQQYIVQTLSTLDTSSIHGEAAFLVFARKGGYLWWLNVGDCVLYLINKEYSNLGQYAVNQRSFFEWIGETNTFHQPVPCYTTGIKPLRQGRNIILAVTDGVLEFGNRPYENPKVLCESAFGSADILDGVRQILDTVKSENGADSATIIAWSLMWDKPGQWSSDWPQGA